MKEMADRIALPLESGGLGAEDRTVEHKTHEEHLASGAALQRIVTEDNQTRYASGQSVQMRCYICRKYRQQMRNTCWMCKGCGMPLCKKDRSNEPLRNESCLVEHRCSDNEYLGCGMLNRAKREWIMPDNLKVFRATRTGGRK